jgi:hypothetical protein
MPPLPVLLAVGFNVALPYGMALKLTVAISAIGLPVAAWALGRLSRLPTPIPVCLSVAVLPFSSMIPFLLRRQHPLIGW